MKIIICVRDLRWGIGRHVIKFIQVLEKKKEIEKILLISSHKVDVFGEKVEMKILKLRGNTFLLREPFFAWECTRFLKNLLREEKYDLLDIRQPVLLSNLRIPKVYNVHVTHFQFSREAVNKRYFFLISLFHYIYRWFDDIQFKFANRIVFVSRKTLVDFTSKYRKYSQKALYIPNFRDLEIFSPVEESEILALRTKFRIGKEAFVIFYCGRLDKMKNIPALVKTVESLKKQYGQVVFLMAGDGRMKAKLINHDHIIYLGQLEPTKLNEIYNLADLTVLPSFYENFPGIVLESIAAGTMVISTDVGDIKDFLPEDLIIRGFSSQNITRKIEEVMFLSKKEREKKISYLQEKIITLFNPEKNSQEKLNIYKEVIQNYHAGGYSQTS